MFRRPFAIAAAIAVTALTGGSVALAQTPAPSTGGATFGAAGLTVTPGALVGAPARITGKLAAAAGGTVRVERQDPSSGDWEAIGRGRADAAGAFSVRWTPDANGRWPLRAVPDATTATAASASTAPTGVATIYKPTRATWYGLFGHRTACGVKLTRTTMGVAHKTLPCGTMVAVYLDGRSIEVPVIDRGPYAKGVALDLTWAAAQALGMEGTDHVGWTPLDLPPSPSGDGGNAPAVAANPTRGGGAGVA